MIRSLIAIALLSLPAAAADEPWIETRTITDAGQIASVAWTERVEASILAR